MREHLGLRLDGIRWLRCAKAERLLALDPANKLRSNAARLAGKPRARMGGKARGSRERESEAMVFEVGGLEPGIHIEAAIAHVAGLVLTHHALGRELDLLFC